MKAEYEPCPFWKDWTDEERQAKEQLSIMLGGQSFEPHFLDWELLQLIRSNPEIEFRYLLEKFGKMITMKKDIDVENILQKDFPNEHQFVAANPHSIHGVDKYGHPIVTILEINHRVYCMRFGRN